MQISYSSPIHCLIVKRTSAEVDAILRDARPWLYRLALAITARPEVAEDVAQDALIRAARSREQLRSVTDSKAWLRTIVVRCAISSLGQPAATTQADKPVTNDPTDIVAVHLTLSRLDPMHRAVLALAHFEGLTYEEIGKVLDVPVGTVASRLHTARDAFRKEWQK